MFRNPKDAMHNHPDLNLRPRWL